MEYEILILVRTGELVCAYPKGHNWKSGEREPIFTILPYGCEEKELYELLNGEYKYQGGKIIHQETGQEYSKDIVLTAQDTPIFTSMNKQVADELDPSWGSKEITACKFLSPKYLPYDQDFKSVRKYWFNKFRLFKDEEGIKQFLADIMFKDYGNIAEAGKNLPQKTKDAIFASDIFTKDDTDWMKWTWREK